MRKNPLKWLKFGQPQNARSTELNKTAESSSETTAKETSYASGTYWQKRSDLLYYRYIDYIMRVVAVDGNSMIDVGSGNCPYLEWFDWIDEKTSIDIRTPYQSENVIGIEGDIFETKFSKKFDVCTCFQVLEHVPEAGKFARRLQKMADMLIVSVPYKWPEQSTVGHVHDPVDMNKLTDWMGRSPNYSIVVEEPFRSNKNKRLIAVYDMKSPRRKFGSKDVKARVLLPENPATSV